MPQRLVPRSVGVGLVALTALSSAVAAQVHVTEHEFSLSAGVSTAAHLWHLPAQPTLVGSGTVAFDTFDLARRIEMGAMLSAGVARYVRPALGLGIEAALVVARMSSTCAFRGPVQPDPRELNGQTCNFVNGQRNTAAALALQATATLRALPRSQASPYVKGALGLAVLGRGFVQVQAEYLTEAGQGAVRRVLEAPLLVAAWTATAAAGVNLGTGSGGRFRIEVRDIVIGLPVVTGPADAMATEHPRPTTRIRAVHRPTLAFGAVALLGGPHQRRY